MKVLVVTNMYPTHKTPGFGIFVRDQVEALEQIAGVDVTVWDFKGGGRNYLKAVSQLKGFLGSNDFDAIVSHYGLSGWVTSLAADQPQTVIFHGTDLHHRYTGPLSRLLLRRHGVQPAVASPTLRARLAKRSAEAAILPTGVNLERFRPIDITQARERLGLEPEGKYLLFPSSKSRSIKRFDRAVSLQKALPQVEILSLENVEPDEVGYWINAANAVVVPSSYEGFGLPIVEALACNRPVVSTPVGIAPLALKNLEGTLCAEFDLQVWADFLHKHLVANDPRIEGRDRAQWFSRELMAERLLRALSTTWQGGTGSQTSSR